MKVKGSILAVLEYIVRYPTRCLSLRGRRHDTGSQSYQSKCFTANH